MKINKLFTIFLTFLMLSSVAPAKIVTSDMLDVPKKPEYRLGTGSESEKEFKVVSTVEEKQAKLKREYVKSKSYADYTIKDLSKEVAALSDIDKENMLEDISILWSGAAAKSETVKFTIYKLANPDADKPDKNIVQKVIRPLAGFSSLAGAGFMNPIAATTAIMSGALVSSLSTDDRELNYKYTKVTDADMIMLLKRVDDLQRRLITDYMDYITAYRAVNLTGETVKKSFANVQKRHAKRETVLIADSYYRNALENKKRAETIFLSKRAALEQTVGIEAMAEFEAALAEREKNKSAE